MISSFVKGYQPLHQRESGQRSGKSDETSTSSSFQSHHQYPAKSYLCIFWARWTPWILIICLATSNCVTLAKLRTKDIPNAVYSPASSAIKYKNVVFQAGIDSDMSPYQGRPTNESEHLWEELHKYGVSQIPLSDAALLANRTSPIPGKPGNYVVILEVFHQLHCLSHIRRRLFWDKPTPPEDDVALNMKHLDHCIDSIRQSLMCSSDVTPLPYVWWSKYGQLLPSTAVTHTCRDFDALLEWAKEHRAPKMDQTVQVYDALGEQVVYDLG